MKVSGFYFELPEELITQYPPEKRDSSRLVVLGEKTGEIEYGKFHDILEHLNEGDTLVSNSTRVLPVGPIGEKEETGGKIGSLFLKRIEGDKWECLTRLGRKAKVGTVSTFEEGKLGAIVGEVGEEGNRIIEFKYDGIFEQALDELGQMPLPPYTHEKLEDKKRYQAVCSKEKEPAAIPTAESHFTEELLKEIKGKGVNIAYLALHVGLGIFRPVEADDVDNHVMHSEYYHLDKENAESINKTKKAGKRVIVIRTIPSRALETIGNENGRVRRQSGWTDIFIYPGYKFKIVDSLITNFRLLEPALIMLVSVLVGQDNVMSACSTAVEERYRFLSFRDSMFIK